MKRNLLVIASFAILSASTYAQTEQALAYPTEMIENPPSVMGVNDPYLGASVAVSDDGEVMATGAWGYENTTLGSGVDYGSVTVYRKDASGNFVQDAFISDVTAAFANNRFGWDVALDLDGNTLAIGAPFYCNGDINAGCGATHIGRVYIYRYAAGVWTLEDQFNATGDNEAADTDFGASVSLTDDGNTVAIGAPGKRVIQFNPFFLATDAGSVYTYTFAGGNWTQEAILVSNDIATRDGLGYDVAISDDGSTIIAGAVNPIVGGNNSNTAYIFRNSGSAWTQEAKLIPSDPSPNSLFGRSVDVSDDGNTAIIGAPNNSTGKAYIFNFAGSAWTEGVNLTAQAGGNEFGYSVAITGDGVVAAVGDPSANATGEAFLFSPNPLSFTVATPLNQGTSSADDEYGSSIAISDGAYEIPVGAPGSSTTTNNLGKTSVFTYPRTTLPVELVRFDAEYVGNGNVDLSWSTASETDNDGFVIERSSNSQDWSEVGFVTGNGTTDIVSEYSHTDAVDGAGIYFYRLKQVDIDGSFEYSDVKQVVVKEADFRVLVTNPVFSELQFTGEAFNKFDRAEASIFNMQGALVDQFNITGSSHNVSNLSTGTYVLIIRDGNSSKTVKFIKQ